MLAKHMGEGRPACVCARVLVPVDGCVFVCVLFRRWSGLGLGGTTTGGRKGGGNGLCVQAAQLGGLQVSYAQLLNSRHAWKGGVGVTQGLALGAALRARVCAPALGWGQAGRTHVQLPLRAAGLRPARQLFAVSACRSLAFNVRPPTRPTPPPHCTVAAVALCRSSWSAAAPRPRPGLRPRRRCPPAASLAAAATSAPAASAPAAVPCGPRRPPRRRSGPRRHPPRSSPAGRSARRRATSRTGRPAGVPVRPCSAGGAWRAAWRLRTR